ncbi:MAG TPA: hypothetical protein VJN22_02985 [Candidatus Eremiobacteraceae bacterium]|nr:hypothetical protein [Candidatus Eremiobacteraceae bacterium]
MRSQEIVIEFTGPAGIERESELVAALLEVPGVDAVRINRYEGRAIVTGDPALAAPAALCEAIAHAGCEPGEVWFAE